MKRKIILFGICIVLSTVVYGQCKIISKEKHTKRIEKRVPLEIDRFTQSKPLFKKYFVAAFSSFLQTTTGEYYFMVPFSRSYSSRFEVYEKTPLIFYLEDGGVLTLNPLEAIEGKMLGLTTFNIFLYYKITKEQIEKLANSDILSLRIYFIAEKEIENTYEDDLGRYFEFEIHSDKYRTNVFDAANCILQN